MFKIVRYTPEWKAAWNQYVATSRNGTFLFKRDYMDYHSDRFCDHSLLFLLEEKVFAIMPAHEQQETFCSHLGLTYGGLVVDNHVTAVDTLQIFSELNDYLLKEGFRRVIYKPVPHIYHHAPAEEDLYALFWQCKARLIKRDISSAVNRLHPVPWRKINRHQLSWVHRHDIEVHADDRFELFWPILEANLSDRHHAHPVHTLEEITLLKSRFPENIVQYNAYVDGEIAGGATVYLTPQVVHGQYSATNQLGKQMKVMEAIYERLLNDHPEVPFVDFGRSTTEHGSQLNEGLISHKEGHGGRAVCYDTYEWEL